MGRAHLGMIIPMPVKKKTDWFYRIFSTRIVMYYCGPCRPITLRLVFLAGSNFSEFSRERPKSLIEEPAKNVYTNVFSLNLASKQGVANEQGSCIAS